MIKNSYGLSGVYDCRFLSQGVNDTYLILSSCGNYIFRLYRYGWRGREDVEFEVEFVNQLDRSDAPVSSFVSDSKGGQVNSIKCPEGERYGVLMKSVNFGGEENHCLLSGYEKSYGGKLAKVHNVSRSIELSTMSRHIDLEYLIHSPVRMVEEYFPDKAKELAYLKGFAVDLEREISDKDAGGLTKHLIHGDVTGGNAGVSEKGEFLFFDFDCCGLGWRSYDLGTFLWSAVQFGKTTEVWSRFIDGYQEVCTLTKADLEAAPLFSAARNFWIMGYSLSQVGARGSHFYKERDFISDVSFFKDWKNTLPS